MNTRRIKIVACSLWLIATSISQLAFAKPIALQDVRTFDNTQNNRVVLFLSAPVKYKEFALTNPDRVVFDLFNTSLKPGLNNLTVQSPLIHSVRLRQTSPKSLRVVIDVAQATTVKITQIAAQNQLGNHIVIDLRANAFAKTVKHDEVAATKSVATVTQQAKLIVQKPVETKVVAQKIEPTADEVATDTASKPVISLESRGPRSKVVVVIDAGHGGKDSGANGPSGTHEKDVVLAISRELKSQIDAQPGMQAVLTRRGDYYIELRDRLNIARKYKADLFIAVHADAYKKPSSQGASVFALSQRGASSEAARWLAEKENHSELGNADLKDKSYIVRSVLLDLSQTATILSSLQLGNEVLRNLGRIARLHNNKVEQARFVVLKSPDIPSILIETGFISNPNEESNLNNPMYRHQLAYAICQGVKSYFWVHAPQDVMSLQRQKHFA